MGILKNKDHCKHCRLKLCHLLKYEWAKIRPQLCKILTASYHNAVVIAAKQGRAEMFKGAGAQS